MGHSTGQQRQLGYLAPGSTEPYPWDEWAMNHGPNIVAYFHEVVANKNLYGSEIGYGLIQVKPIDRSVGGNAESKDTRMRSKRLGGLLRLRLSAGPAWGPVPRVGGWVGERKSV